MPTLRADTYIYYHRRIFVQYMNHLLYLNLEVALLFTLPEKITEALNYKFHTRFHTKKNISLSFLTMVRYSDLCANHRFKIQIIQTINDTVHIYMLVHATSFSSLSYIRVLWELQSCYRLYDAETFISHPTWWGFSFQWHSHLPWNGSLF